MLIEYAKVGEKLITPCPYYKTESPPKVGSEWCLKCTYNETCNKDKQYIYCGHVRNEQ